jgi:hypothetical protein
VRFCLRLRLFNPLGAFFCKYPTPQLRRIGRTGSFPKIVPPIDHQPGFADRIAEIDKLKVGHRAHLEKLDALFASLQERAFFGELTGAIAVKRSWKRHDAKKSSAQNSRLLYQFWLVKRFTIWRKQSKAVLARPNLDPNASQPPNLSRFLQL